MNISEINQVISSMKREKGSIITNYYYNIADDGEDYEIIRSKDSLVFIKNQVKRQDALFCTTDMKDCLKILKTLDKDVMLSIVSKDSDYDTHSFDAAGFELYAVYERFGDRLYDVDTQSELMKDNKMDSKYDESYGEYPSKDDIPEIQRILEEVFDPLTDDFFTDEELLSLIENKNVVVERTAKRIYCINIFQIFGKKFYGNILWNIGMPYVSYSIEKKTLLEAIRNKGVNYRYLWIRKDNASALARNLTQKSENIYNYIFRKK